MDYVSSRSFAHASHCRQAFSNCVLASSSVGAWSSVRIFRWVAKHAAERPEPAHVARPCVTFRSGVVPGFCPNISASEALLVLCIISAWAGSRSIR